MRRLEQDKIYKHFIERTRLGGAQKLFLYAATALVWVSGTAWILLRYAGEWRDELGAMNSPLQPLALKIHGAAAIAFTLVLGSLIPVHMRRGWVLKRNRPSGVIVASTCATLVFTGWALYYVAGESARSFVSLFHWVVGLALPLVIYFHILAWRRRKVS